MIRKSPSKAQILSARPTYKAAVENARVQVNNGKTVSYEEVRRWLQSWGTEKELPPPRCK